VIYLIQQARDVLPTVGTVTQQQAGAWLRSAHLADRQIIMQGDGGGSASLAMHPTICFPNGVPLVGGTCRVPPGLTFHSGGAIDGQVQIVDQHGAVTLQAMPDPGGTTFHIRALVDPSLVTSQVANPQDHPLAGATADDPPLQILNAILQLLHLPTTNQAGRTAYEYNLAQQAFNGDCSRVLGTYATVARAEAFWIRASVVADAAQLMAKHPAEAAWLQQMGKERIEVEFVHKGSVIDPARVQFGFPPEVRTSHLNKQVLGDILWRVDSTVNEGCRPSAATRAQLRQMALGQNVTVIGASGP
jgi:hypothetical protein